MANPTITSINPVLGDIQGGILVTVSGTNFSSAWSVEIGGVRVVPEKVCETYVDVRSPALAPGFYDVKVYTAMSSVTSASMYESWSPVQVAGMRLFDTSTGITFSTSSFTSSFVSEWDDRGGAHKNFLQASSSKQPRYVYNHFGPDLAPLPALVGNSTTMMMNTSGKELLPTGKTFFWVAKTKNVDNTIGTPGNVPCSVIGDKDTSPWAGSAGYYTGSLAQVNWSDDTAQWELKTFGSSIADGRPHFCMITHEHTSPWTMRGYVDGAQVGGGMVSRYNTTHVGWQTLFSGLNGNDDFFEGECACVGVVTNVLSVNDQAKLYTWAYGKFIRKSYGWKTLITSSSWTHRDGCGLVYMSGSLSSSLYLVAGWDPTSKNEIYRSTNDGASWTLIRANDANPPATGSTAMFRPRHAMPVFTHRAGNTDYIYVIGGDSLDGFYANGPGDVWRSTDGVTWERVADNCPWIGRVNHMACSYKGALYLFGGQTNYQSGSTGLNDVWMSKDHGANWSQLASGSWTGRGIGAVMVFNDKIWLVAGGTTDTLPANYREFNDVWNFDGNTWQCALASGSSPFPARHYTTGFVFADKMWFGDGYNSANVGDLWKSSDGVNWVEHTLLPWGPRHADSWAAGPTYAYHCGGYAGDVGDISFFRLEAL